jgi:hypothetical protein
MKRSVSLVGLVIFLSLILTGAVVFATGGTSTVTTKTGTTVGAPQPPGKCCIAGKYNGFHKRIPSKTCPKPDEGKFIMEIFQDKGCGSKIWGTVTDPKDGSKQNFEGKVTARGACCYIEGTMKKVGAAAPVPVEETKFWGTLCKKGAKWSGNGEYVDSKGCKGTWSMTQM